MSLVAGIYGDMGNGSTDNIPGGREGAIGCYDSTRQEFWLFGGNGYASNYTYGYLNDLWKYRVIDSTWTWVSGSNGVNHPGDYAGETSVPSRSGGVGWFDSSTQEFWVFGGFGPGNSYYNDLWKYQVNGNSWNFVSGGKNQRGNNGVKEQATATNIPGSRSGAAGFYDSTNQEFWMFGGYGYGRTSSKGFLNDLWRYRVSDNTWTWISGSDTVDQPGVYGVRGVAHPSNVPGGRRGAAAWYDSSKQEFWLFGGYYYYDYSVGAYFCGTVE